MDLKNQKLSFKSKVSDLMQQYERQKSEEQYQKQQMKKQIMLDIMNKRQKPHIDPHTHKSHSQSIENIEKTAQSALPQEEKQPVQSQSYLKESAYLKNEGKNTFGREGQANPQSRVKQYQEEEHQFDKIEELTFNMKRRNKSLEEQINIKALLKDDEDLWQAKEEKPTPQENKSSNSYSKIHAWQKSEYKPVEKEDSEEDTYEKEEDQPVMPSGKYSKYFKGPEGPVQSRSYYGNKTDYLHREEDDPIDDHEGEAEPNEVEEEVEPEDNRGVFLTMEESESMTASEMPKNYAFEIKMDKSIDPESMEQMKKQKIKELEKKRQVRIEEFRRNQSQKKVQMPKGRNSYSKKHDKAQKDDYNQPELPPRSGTIEKKNPSQRSSKVEKEQPMAKNEPLNRNEPINRPQPINKNSQAIIQTHDSQYNIKPTPKQYSNFSQNYEPINKLPPSKQTNYPSSSEDREIKPISPFRTPKSMLNDNRGKSQNKNPNIFSIQTQNPREKSGTKIITQPKIQPKDRKNSFTKQSNKKLMINAITYVCFPGELNRRERERLIDVLQTSEYEFFIFLFKQYSRKIIKGIYILDNSQTKLEKIYGEKAPAEITVDRVQEFYRFDSGSREFKKVDGCRSFSLSIHAIDQR